MGEEQEGRQQNTQNGNVVTNTAKDVAKEKVKKEVQKEVAKRAAETSAKLAAKSSIFAALGPILVWVLIIIVAIIIIVGIIMFFMTVPGMVMEQLKEFASDLADSIFSYFGADTTRQIDEQEIYDVLNYLEQMGYDLKGYGFINENADENDANYDEKVGVIRDPETGLIKDLDEGKWFGGKQEAYSDIIELYIMSDNYAYTVKNFNNVSSWITPFKWLQAIGHHIGDFFGIDNTKWGKGLISIYYEDGSLGEIGDSYQNGILKINSIEIDPSAKKMKIRKGWGNNAFEYNLDGWTGRYGMPLEFLLSIHIATMKPDLGYDMITEFDTDVRIILRTINEGVVDASYKNSSGAYVTYEEIEEAIYDGVSDDIWNKFKNWVDEKIGGLTDEEKAILESKGIVGDDDTINEILSKLKNTQDYNFKTFVPYISKVTNHWFRDVYFTLSEDEVKNTLLTRTDIDYEKITNERWTLYETYPEGSEREGEYKLFVYDENAEYGIGEPFEGTQQEANEKNIKVVKKPISTTAADMGSEDYIANPNNPESEKGAIIELNTDGSWSAYENKDTESEAYERVYPEADENSVEGKIYYKVKFANDVVQKEDGLRGVTNKNIKDMFLNRYYFSYDGSTETAELIKKAKEQTGIMFGSVPKDKLETEISGTTNPEDDEPYQIKDLVSNVSITQDSLGAFSMLENTHTLDADYIYRDFKELIVELGYFTQKELSEGTPELLQWLIPSIGSGGYPKRVLDKVENELGTFAHSKQDYEANEKDKLATLYEKISQMQEEEQFEGNVPETGNVSGISTNNNSQNLSQVSGLNSNNTSDSELSSNKSNINLKNVKGTGASFVLERVDESGDGYQSVLVSGNVKYLHRYQGGQSYSGIEFFWAGGSRTLGQAACGLFACFNVLTGYGYDFQPAKELAGYKWPATMDAVKNLMEEKGVTGQFIDYTDTAALDEALNEGRPAILLFQSTVDKQGVSWTSGGHFVALAGKDKEGNILTLDSAAQGNVKRHDYPGTVEDMLPAFQSAPIWIADEPPTGMKQEGEPYEGYLGDEAVVSPVTGILLDYGTYDEDDKDAGYRKNINKPDVEPESVGYAKILVLNEEIADQLVNCDTHSKDTDTKNGIEGQINISQKPQKVEDMKNWTDEERALYGYKLFKDDYEDGGIAGYVIYIDGFKCELPKEESEDDGTEDKDREEIVWDENYQAGSGQELSMEYFKSQAAKGKGDWFQNCEYEETLYEPDDVYKLLSEKLEEQQKARAEAKNIAAPLYSFTGTLEGETKELLLIKEGTVIGRTYTDKEVVESRGETYVKPEEPEEGEEDTREVQGNYLRIIMRDLDDTVVENVEDYMKLDEAEYNQELDFEKFLFWMGVYAEGGDLVNKGGKWYSKPVDVGDDVGSTGLTHFYGITDYNVEVAKKLGYNVTTSSWQEDLPLDMLTDVFLTLIEEDKAYIKSELGENIEDGYLQAFISVKHNYGNLTKRGDEYKSTGKVSESTWCTYEGKDEFADALTRRRVAEWKIITEGIYMNYNDGNTGEIDWKYPYGTGTQYSEETPFTDFLKDHNINDVNIMEPDS